LLDGVYFSAAEASDLIVDGRLVNTCDDVENWTCGQTAVQSDATKNGILAAVSQKDGKIFTASCSHTCKVW